ncbi:MAG: hypothetical protein P0Y55_13070 [Candidatus Cohnella colombiensis]|uniref:Uncharacterized protein n=1 Tax=Candidatus Cohnella colombiensis TaxID=3121368 RepID=A0AA95EVH1_9BACL|nr:MAG: hypothetical protein P0Y55_13070 [Cohnella sp.]
MRNVAEATTELNLYREQRPKRRNTGAILFFALFWFILIAGGVYAAKLYSDNIQDKLSSRLENQTASQIALIQQDYTSRLTALENDYTTQLAEMGSKIEALNELLTFAKDNTDTKTDNSNKLYTQLAEVKKQLNELKKSLDVLK